MKKQSVPHIKLKKHEELWLKSLYENIRAKEKATYRKLRAKLFEQLPSDFHPNQIDQRLVNYNGEELTLLGIYTIDPKTDIINKADLVIKASRDLLKGDPDRQVIQAAEISKSINIPEAEVGMIFKLISLYGNFWRGANGAQDYYGHSSINITDDNVFDEYMNFTSIDDKISEYYNRNDVSVSKLEALRNENLSVTESGRNRDSSLLLNPIFKSRIATIELKLCFVLMPFNESWSDRVYKSYIRENIESMGFQCLRADNLNGMIIMEDIWVNIYQASIVIADVTNRNPNVMYEVGIAHTIGRPVILITQNINDIPFDFKHLRHYHYEDNSDGLAKFTILMKEILPEIYKSAYPETITFFD